MIDAELNLESGLTRVGETCNSIDEIMEAAYRLVAEKKGIPFVDISPRAKREKKGMYLNYVIKRGDSVVESLYNFRNNIGNPEILAFSPDDLAFKFHYDATYYTWLIIHLQNIHSIVQWEVYPQFRSLVTIEAIANSIEHGSQFGQLGNINITYFFGDGLLLSIEDPGHGFNPRKIHRTRGGVYVFNNADNVSVGFESISTGFRTLIYYPLNRTK